MPNKKDSSRHRRHLKIRKKITGTAERPRLVVFRSLSHIYAQLVNDAKHKVILGCSDLKTKGKDKKTKKAKQIGIDIAKMAQEKKIVSVTFDRNGYKYHGRVKAVAEGAREGGLKF